MIPPLPIESHYIVKDNAHEEQKNLATLILFHCQNYFVDDGNKNEVEKHKVYLNLVSQMLHTRIDGRAFTNIVAINDTYGPYTIGQAIYDPLFKQILVWKDHHSAEQFKTVWGSNRDSNKDLDSNLKTLTDAVLAHGFDDKTFHNIYIAGLFHHPQSHQQFRNMGVLNKPGIKMYVVQPIYDEQFTNISDTIDIVSFKEMGVDPTGHNISIEELTAWQQCAIDESIDDGERNHQLSLSYASSGKRGHFDNRVSECIKDIHRQLAGMALTEPSTITHTKETIYGNVIPDNPPTLLKDQLPGKGNLLREGPNSRVYGIHICLNNVLIMKKNSREGQSFPWMDVYEEQITSEVYMYNFHKNILKGLGLKMEETWGTDPKTVKVVYRGFLPHELNTAGAWIEATCFRIETTQENLELFAGVRGGSIYEVVDISKTVLRIPSQFLADKLSF